MIISEALNQAAVQLASNGITEPLREANSLLALALGKDRIFLITNSAHPLTELEKKAFGKILERRCNHEPFQHIAGKQEFWGLDFYVSPDVLVPRPETEMIVDEAVRLYPKNADIEFCEIGIGSGCISVSVLKEFPSAHAFGFDISVEALMIARKNAETHNVGQRLKLGVSDVFESIKPFKFELVVSNPPYVPLNAVSGLQAEVRDFDPLEALTDGNDGLSIIRRMVNETPGYLRGGGHLLMEIGFSQSDAVREMFDLSVWGGLDFLSDLQGIPRLVRAQLANDKEFNPKTV